MCLKYKISRSEPYRCWARATIQKISRAGTNAFLTCYTDSLETYKVEKSGQHAALKVLSCFSAQFQTTCSTAEPPKDKVPCRSSAMTHRVTLYHPSFARVHHFHPFTWSFTSSPSIYPPLSLFQLSTRSFTTGRCTWWHWGRNPLTKEIFETPWRSSGRMNTEHPTRLMTFMVFRDVSQ